MYFLKPWSLSEYIYWYIITDFLYNELFGNILYLLMVSTLYVHPTWTHWLNPLAPSVREARHKNQVSEWSSSILSSATQSNPSRAHWSREWSVSAFRATVVCVRVFIFNYLAWSVADIWLLFGGFWCNSVNPELRLICFMHFNRANGFIRLAINTCLKLYAFFLCQVVFTDRSFFHRRIVAKVQVYFFKGRVRS